MNRFLCVLTVSLAFSLSALAQSDSTPYPQATPDPMFPDRATEDAVKRADDLNRRSDALRMTQNLPPSVPDAKRAEFMNLIEPLYRESTEEEKAMMAPSEADIEGYREFTKGKDAGAFRIVQDRGCADNPKVVSASTDCSRLSMPGAGSGYSFRFGDYRMHHLSDIVFKKGRFESLAVLDHGIMVDLGDVPVERITKKTDGVEYLTKIKPSKNFNQAADLATRLTKGIKEGGRTYASILPVKENSTYVLRSIAYDGEALRKIGAFVFNELEMDKRRDVLVAFRVVRLTEDGYATVVWKIINDDKPPKLKADKK